MIVFECPNCKAKLQVADEHAGATIQCPGCQGMAAAPRSAAVVAEAITSAPAVAPSMPAAPTAVTTPDLAHAERRRTDEGDLDDRPRRRRDEVAKPKAGMGVGMILLLVFGIGACIVVPVMIALLVPAVQKVREAAARTQSTNNLKQIGLGFHAHHDMFKHFPFNGSDGNQIAPGMPRNAQQKNAVGGNFSSGSWGFQILPFIEQNVMFDRADRSAGVMTYMCPGRGRPPLEAGRGAWSDYFYNNYLNDSNQAARADAPSRRPRIASITDGSSNTIMVGHGNISRTQYGQSGNVTLSSNIFDGGTFGTARAGNNGQTSPTGVILRRDDDTPPTFATWGGPFPQGALFVLGDGTVRMIAYGTPSFSAFLTPSGNEVIDLPD